MFMNYIKRQLEEALESYLMILFKYIFFQNKFANNYMYVKYNNSFWNKTVKV